MATVSKFSRGSVAGNAWTSPANATADDAVYTTAAPAKNSSVVGDWDFAAFLDAEIPVGSTINSVTLEIQLKSSTTGSTGATIGLTAKSAGAAVGTEVTNGMTLTDVLLTRAYSTVPTETDLKTAGRLAASVAGKRAASNTAVTWSVDYVKVTVDYTVPPPNANGTVSVTGGGAVTAARQKGGQSAGAKTGGGAVALASSGAHTKAVAATGGGSFAAATSGAHQGSVTATGGGVFASARQKGAQSAAAETGGGAVVISRSKGALAAALATGAGVVALARSKGGQAASLLTGGGVASVARRKGGQSAQAATGGGVVTLLYEAGGSSSGHSGTLSVTGGGVLALQARKGAALAQVVTGGGIVAAVVSTGRAAAIAATGGGSAGVAAAKGASVALDLTGGGGATIAYSAVAPTPAQLLSEAALAAFGGDARQAHDFLVSRAVNLAPGSRLPQLRYMNWIERRAQARLASWAMDWIEPACDHETCGQLRRRWGTDPGRS